MRRPWSVSLLALTAALSACGPSVRRDLGSVQQSAITFDDMCHLQDYFDQRVASHAPALRAFDELSTETTREARDEHGRMRPIVLGEGTYVVSQRSDRLRLHRLLREEYSRVPTDLGLTAVEAQVRVRVNWWQAGGIRRVRNDGPVVITHGEHTATLPPHPCVGEFLFGERAYEMRRCFVEADRARARGEIPPECHVSVEGSGHEATADAGTPVNVPVSVPVSADAGASAAPADAAISATGEARNQ